MMDVMSTKFRVKKVYKILQQIVEEGYTSKKLSKIFKEHLVSDSYIGFDDQGL